MSREQLLKRISNPLAKEKVVQLALDKACIPGDLIELSLYPQSETAFRASRVLEHLVYLRIADFVPFLPDFLSAYFLQKNCSCQRHFAKIMMYLTDSESALISASLINQVIETTFEWLIDPETPVAVKVNCMDILFNLSSGHPWISDELRSQIEFLLRDGSAAIQSRGKRILKKLHS